MYDDEYDDDLPPNLRAAQAAKNLLDAVEPKEFDEELQGVVQECLDASRQAREAANFRNRELTPAERDCMAQAENFGHTIPRQPGSIFEQRRREGWLQPGAERFERLELGAFLRSMVTGPQNDLEFRALSEGSDSAGGHLVPEPLSARIIDMLRTRLVIAKAGAEIWPLESESLKVAKLTGDVGLSWAAEATTAVSTDPTFGSVTLIPKTFRGIIRASRELIQDAPNIERVLQNSFVQSMARELDRVSLLGSSTSGEPQGLSGSTAVPTVEVGTTGAGGAVITFEPLLNGLQALMEANAETDRVACILSPRTWIELQKLQESSTGTVYGQPLQMPEALRNVTFLPTAAVTNDFGWGATTDATEAYMGNFREFMVGNRLDARVEVLKERYANTYQFGYLGHLRADVAWQHDESFVTLKGIKATT